MQHYDDRKKSSAFYFERSHTLSINKKRWISLAIATLLGVAGMIYCYNSDGDYEQLEKLQVVASNMQSEVSAFL